MLSTLACLSAPVLLVHCCLPGFAPNFQSRRTVGGALAQLTVLHLHDNDIGDNGMKALADASPFGGAIFWEYFDDIAD